MLALALSLFAVLVAAAPAEPDALLAPETRQSLALRARYGVPVPQSSAKVYVYSVAAHHTRTEWSTIAWRNADGAWAVSQMGEEGPGGLLAIEPRLLPQTAKKLSAREGLYLDQLLRAKGLYREAPRRSGEVGVGAPFHVMEIVGDEGRTVVRWNGRLRGRAGLVADIVLGRE